MKRLSILIVIAILLVTTTPAYAGDWSEWYSRYQKYQATHATASQTYIDDDKTGGGGPVTPRTSGGTGSGATYNSSYYSRPDGSGYAEFSRPVLSDAEIFARANKRVYFPTAEAAQQYVSNLAANTYVKVSTTGGGVAVYQIVGNK